MKNLWIIAALLMLMPLASAEIIFKQNQYADLKLPCYNESDAFCSEDTICNLTVMYPDGSVMIQGRAMTNQIVFHNYTIPDTHLTGGYTGIVECNDLGKYGKTYFNFKVTNTGFDYNAGDMALIVSIAIVFFLIAISMMMDTAWIATIAGMGSFIVGLYLYIQGFGGMKSLLSEGLGMIMIGLGTIFIFWSLKEIADGDEEPEAS